MRRRGNRVIDLGKAREMLLEAVAGDRAHFSACFHEKHREECVEVKVKYEVCGVQLDRNGAALRLIISVNGMWPAQVEVERSRLRDILTGAMRENFPFLIKDTYTVSLDMDSVREVNREGNLRQFREEMEYAIQAHGFTLDDILPTIMGFVNDSLKETSYASIEELLSSGQKARKPNGTVLDITPPGVPCPHCCGLLSEDSLRELMMKFYIRFRVDRDRFDG